MVMKKNKTATQVLEDQIMDRAAKQMADEIDFEVLCSLLADIGWTKVMLDTLGSNSRAWDIKDWLSAECKKEYKQRGRSFVFESKDEAALFKLTWL
jgi:hypothetical protein